MDNSLIIPLVTIIIPSVGSLDNLIRLLDSIILQEESNNKIQVICIRPLLDDKDHSVLSNYQTFFLDCKFIEFDFKAIDSAKNVAIKFAAGKLLWFLNENCILKNRDLLKSIICLHAQNPDVEIIGGNYFYNDIMFNDDRSEIIKVSFFNSGARFSSSYKMYERFKTTRIISSMLNIELGPKPQVDRYDNHNINVYPIILMWLKEIYQNTRFLFLFMVRVFCKIYYFLLHPILCKIFSMSVYHCKTYCSGDWQNWIILFQRIKNKIKCNGFTFKKK
jgi:hypothetical protein